MDINMELENKIYFGHSYKLIQDPMVFFMGSFFTAHFGLQMLQRKQLNRSPA
jgi:hypothetical protein